jgi:hypothetical protein
VLVRNAGSSSLKFTLFDDDKPPRRLLPGSVDRFGSNPADARELVSARIATVPGEIELHAIGHGGRRLDAPQPVTQGSIKVVSLIFLFPLNFSRSSGFACGRKNQEKEERERLRATRTTLTLPDSSRRRFSAASTYWFFRR